MNILVCFTVVPDFDRFSEEDWAETAESGRPPSNRPMTWGYFDESALEWSLRLADECRGMGEALSVTALTVSPRGDGGFLETLAALPFDRLVRIDSDIANNPEGTSALIAAFAEQNGGFDLILTGNQGSGFSSGLVPCFTANYLGIPCVRELTELNLFTNKTLRLRRRAEGGIMEESYRLPLLAAMGNSSVSYLRVPTLKAKLNAKGKAPELISPDSLLPEPPEPRHKTVSLKRERGGRACRFIVGESAEDKAGKLLRDCLTPLPQRGAAAESDAAAPQPNSAALTWRFFPDQGPRLSDAPLVLALGRGAGSRAAVEAIAPLASALGVEICGSRAAVLSGWVDSSRLVGISGQTIAPRICIAAGVSGSAAFVAGIKDSELIVAVNNDPNAPVFQQADIGIVEDLHLFFAALEELLFPSE